MPINPPRPSDPIPAGIGQKIVAALDQLRLQALWPLVYDEVHNYLYYDGPEDIGYIRITGAGDSQGRYPWVQCFPDPAGSGTFVNGTKTGTITPLSDPAKELNGNGGLWSGTPFVVECWRDRQKFLWFRASACPS